MGGVAFGQTLKHLRKKAKISSKSLSIQVGKAATYVSQLERGLIKNPNYNTCHKLLEFVSVEPDSIEQVLNKHGLISDLNISIEDIERMNRSEPLRKESPQKVEINSRIYAGKYRDTKDKNDNIYSIFDTLADTDITRASVVINNLYKLIQDENNLDFLCGVLSFDYAQLSPKMKADILAKLRKLLRGSKVDPIVKIRISKS